jgi:hypothetical protein
MVWYKSFLYQAASWNASRWVVVAKEELHFGELLPPRRAHRHQSGDRESCGGAALQQAGNGGAVDRVGLPGGKVTRLSCHRFRSNEVRLWLSLMAYNLGKILAAADAAEEDREVVPNQLAAKVGEEGGRLVKHPDTAG